MLANIASLTLVKAHMVAFWLFQEDTSVNWSDPISLIKHMGWPALTIVAILFVMSAWSIGVMIDRWISFNAARKHQGSSLRWLPALCVKANWMKRSGWPSATKRAIWPRL